MKRQNQAKPKHVCPLVAGCIVAHKLLPFRQIGKLKTKAQVELMFFPKMVPILSVLINCLFLINSLFFDQLSVGVKLGWMVSGCFSVIIV